MAFFNRLMTLSDGRVDLLHETLFMELFYFLHFMTPTRFYIIIHWREKSSTTNMSLAVEHVLFKDMI